MITIKNKKVTFETPNIGAVTYAFTVSDQCAQVINIVPIFSNGVNTTILEVTFDIVYETEACISDAVVTFTATDAKGCSSSTTVPVTNICSDLVVSQSRSTRISLYQIPNQMYIHQNHQQPLLRKYMD